MNPTELRPPILAVDPGEARIGLAISDDLGLLAHPLETIDARSADPVGRIAEIARRRNVAKIIVGLPVRRDGSEGPAAQKARRFLDQLQQALPDTPVIPWDEFGSTKEAQARLHEAGRNVRNSRRVIDQAAACVILREYLESQG